MLKSSRAAQTIGGGLSLAFNPALETLGAPMAALTSIGTDRSAGSILPNGLTASPDSLPECRRLCVADRLYLWPLLQPEALEHASSGNPAFQTCMCFQWRAMWHGWARRS